MVVQNSLKCMQAVDIENTVKCKFYTWLTNREKFSFLALSPSDAFVAAFALKEIGLDRTAVSEGSGAARENEKVESRDRRKEGKDMTEGGKVEEGTKWL